MHFLCDCDTRPIVDVNSKALVHVTQLMTKPLAPSTKIRVPPAVDHSMGIFCPLTLSTLGSDHNVCERDTGSV